MVNCCPSCVMSCGMGQWVSQGALVVNGQNLADIREIASTSEPLFTTLKFLNCKNIFKYLIGRLMYRIYHGELHVLHGLFTKNSNIHVHDTRQKCHYHLLLCRTNLGKCGLRYVGASVWNNILSVNINPNVSEFIFSRSLKAAICNNLL